MPVALVALVVAVATPGLLAVTGLRIVANDWIVSFEYGRDGFPADRYGLTREERTELALLGLRAITPGTEGIALLQRARLPDGSPAFTVPELDHMQDVRDVFGLALRAQAIALVALALLAAGLWRTRLRHAVPLGLLAGALATLVVALLAVPVILLGFDRFFESFHNLFFDPGSWRFPTSDTLIRLYPERFWEDISQLVAALTVLQAVVLAPLAWWWWRRVRPGDAP
ncbi:MAG: TIGR01906 family membrane protein [Gaiella sp.]